ncbi:MAG: hypothetical protein COA44_07430 [Arcobacter sp.]|nr:MAG: hypothetical protein COA44_07430 [Arcobacter sp.]
MRYLIILILFCLSVFADEKIVLELKWEHQFQFAGYYAAKEQGYYKEYGLNVEIKGQDLNNILRASKEVSENRAQYGVGSSSLLSDISQGQPLMLLAAIFEHSPLVLICNKNSDIRHAKDLNGKKIMLAEDEGNSLLFSRMLEMEGIAYISVDLDWEGFKKGEADAISGYLGNEPYILNQEAFAYTIIDPANYGLDAYSDILFTSQKEYLNHPKRVHDFLKASLKGWKYAMGHQEEISHLIMKKYNPNKSLDALLFEASMIARYSLIDLDKIGNIDLNKLLHMLLMMREVNLIKNDVDIYKHLYPGQFSQIKLSEKESNWIAEHPSLRYSSIHWLPKENRHQSKELTQKYIDLISLKSGLSFSYKQKEPATYALAELERGKIDLFIGTQESKNSLKTDVIRKYPLVIVTKNDVDYISHVQSLKMKTIALLKGSSSAKYIENNYPDIQKIYVDTIEEGLKLVSSSAVFATVEALPLVSLHIKEFHMPDVKISGEFPHPYDLKINVRSDYPELISILNKSIKSISIDEHNMINDHWESVEFVQEKDIRGFVVGLFFSVILILILVYSNWRLRFEVQKRQTTEKELQRMLDVVNQNIYMSMTDTKGNISYVSDAFCRLTGYSKNELIGKNHRILKSPQTKDSFYTKMWDEISKGNIWTGELENINKKGEPYWVDASITPLYDDDGNIFSYMAIRKNITIRKQMETLAITDGLSDLYNRRYFNMVFDKEIKRLGREHGTMSFLMLDIDHFKLYNDTYGHLKGDEVLMAISACLKEVCKRATDQVFRLGGEEFGVVLLGMNEEQTHDFSKKLIKAIENLNIKHEENDPYSWVTASLGAVICRFDENTHLDAKDIYQIADDAMYTAKQTGRNRVFISQA